MARRARRGFGELESRSGSGSCLRCAASGGCGTDGARLFGEVAVLVARIVGHFGRKADELHAIFPLVPVTLMTGVPPKRRAAMGVAHDHIIEKPFELEELLGSIARMVASRTP
jgi:hypothetical protein